MSEFELLTSTAMRISELEVEVVVLEVGMRDRLDANRANRCAHLGRSGLLGDPGTHGRGNREGEGKDSEDDEVVRVGEAAVCGGDQRAEGGGYQGWVATSSTCGLCVCGSGMPAWMTTASRRLIPTTRSPFEPQTQLISHDLRPSTSSSRASCTSSRCSCRCTLGLCSFPRRRRQAYNRPRRRRT